MDGTAVKKCGKCKAVKSTEDFNRRGNGYTWQCWECDRAYTVKRCATVRNGARRRSLQPKWHICARRML